MLLEEGEEGSDGRAEGSSAIGDRGQAAISRTLDVDGIGFGPVLKKSSDVWVILYQLRRRQWHPTPVLLPGKSHG